MSDSPQKYSDHMASWAGQDVDVGKETLRVVQGDVKPGEEVLFLPAHTASNPYGKVFAAAGHHQRADFGNPGDKVHFSY